MYMYLKNGQLFDVYFYTPHGAGVYLESRHNRIDTAAARVSYLNGGTDPHHPYTVVEVGDSLEVTFD